MKKVEQKDLMEPVEKKQTKPRVVKQAVKPVISQEIEVVEKKDIVIPSQETAQTIAVQEAVSSVEKIQPTASVIHVTKEAATPVLEAPLSVRPTVVGPQIIAQVQEESLPVNITQASTVQIEPVPTVVEQVSTVQTAQQQNTASQYQTYQQNNSYKKYEKRSDQNTQQGYYQQKQQQEVVRPKIMTQEQLQEFSVQELNQQARRLGIVGASLLLHRELVSRIMEMQENPDKEIVVEGVLEKLPDGFGFLRSSRFDYVSSPDDVYVSPSQIRRFGLRTGDTVIGSIRKPKDNEKYFALFQINLVNGEEPNKLNERPFFDRLSPLHPDKKFRLEYRPEFIATRIMDIFTPLGKGQRALIVAPPKAGKTVLLREIAQSLIANHPECFLIMLLVDERPEEVADMRRCVKGSNAEVISSTFDESAERHVQVAEIVLEKAKRLVEGGKDVVILLDSMTRLARAYNTTAPASGKVLTGGIDASALQRPKRFFGAARNTEEGGSLSIIASALIETGSRMDEVIYEEFKGTGNMEIHMSRKLANRRIFPSFDLLISGTRRDDLLHNEEDLNRAWVLQKFLSNMNTIEAMEFLIEKMKKAKTNEEFFETMSAKKNGHS